MSTVEKCYNIYLFLPVDKLHGTSTIFSSLRQITWQYNYIFSSTFYENSEAAGGGTSLVFSHTFVHPTVLGEDLGDHQSVRVSVILVTEVLAVGDLFSTFVPLDLRRA